MELLLRLSIGNHVRDLSCDAEPDATVGDLIREICTELAIVDEVSLVAERLTGALDPATSLADSGLVSGDTVTLYSGRSQQYAEPSDTSVTGMVILEVSGGPHQGTSWTLKPGTHTIGRATGATLHLPDHSLAFGHLDLRVDERGEIHATAYGDVRVDGQPMPLRREYVIGRGARISAGASQFSFKRTAPVIHGGRDKAGQILFNRTPYFPTAPAKLEVGKIPPPPTPPEPQPVNWLYMVLPVVIGGVLYAVTRNVLTLAFVALSPLMLLANSFYSKKSNTKRYSRQKERWLAQAVKVSEDLAHALAEEKKLLLEAYPSTQQLLQWVTSRSTSLWCRDREDETFLTLRIGAGNVAPLASIDVSERNPLEEYEPELLEIAERARQAGTILQGAPVTTTYAGGGVLGLWGDPNGTARAANALILQAATLHSPEELIITAAIGDDETNLSWITWLPHARSTTSPIDGNHVVTDPNQGRALCDTLNTIASSRAVSRTDTSKGPHIFAVITEKARVDWSALSRMLAQTEGNRVTVLWVGNSEATTPKHCSTVLGFASGSVTCLRRGQPRTVVVPELLDADIAEEAARQLSPMRDAASSNAAASMPRTVHLSTLLGEAFFDPDSVKRNWGSVPKVTLRAPIGMDADGPWLLDMIEDGPHALIAGTSGSGKSELLQTIVASMAAQYPPSRLNFLFVDYKGGAAFGDANMLPHAVGMVTDLDESLSLRALTSLRAELKRREAVLHGKARDIAEYEKLDPLNCPPRLVIVVDEFATLVKEIPDFVAGMVDVAQRGRSLGIHMILATQRPSGAVSENILANTNLRICLRVLDTAESASVIGTADAAYIPPPLRGRSYIRTGPRELHAVQTGWANAPLNAGENPSKVKLGPLNGTRVARRTSKTVDGPAEFKVAVKAIVKAGAGLPTPRRPWLEPLADVINLADVTALAEDSGADGNPHDPARHTSWGVVDDPARQAQYPATIDFEEDGGLLVLGSAGSGKTTLLRTVAASIATAATPAQATLFALDYGNRSLEAVEALPHCGGVFHGEDTERVTAFLLHLDREIKRRRRLMSEHHAASFSELLDGGRTEPRIVVLVDNFSGFTSAFERVDAGDWISLLLRMINEGRQAGVNFVITADRRASLPSSLMASVSGRLVLRMAEPDEYIALGIPPVMVKDLNLPSGRGFMGHELLCQVAVPAGRTNPKEQRSAIAALGSEHTRIAQGVPLLATRYGSEHLAGAARKGRARIGLADISGSTVEVDLRTHLLLVGRHGSGRSALLQRIAAEIASSGGRAIHLGAGGMPALTTPGQHTVVHAPPPEWSRTLAAVLEDPDVNLTNPLVLLVDDGEYVGETAGAELEKLIRKPGVSIVAVLEPDTLLRSYVGWVPELRRTRRSIVMQPDTDTVSQVVGSVQRSRPGLTYPVGRGVLFDEQPVVFQTAVV